MALVSIHVCMFLSDSKDLKPVGTAQSRNSALALENKTKNRYNNVLPCRLNPMLCCQN